MIEISFTKKNQRQCIFTNEILDKKKLLRICKTKDSNFFIDWNQNILGRGAYISNDFLTIIETLNKKKLNRTFKTNIDQEIYNKLINEVKEHYEQKK